MDYAATLLAKLPGAPKRDHGLRQLIETLETYLPEAAMEDVMRAYEFGAAAHDGQTRTRRAGAERSPRCRAIASSAVPATREPTDRCCLFTRRGLIDVNGELRALFEPQ